MSALPAVLLFLLFVLVAAIILFALKTKGDVSAECSLRSFRFALHAKDRSSAQPQGHHSRCGEHPPSVG